MKISKLDLNFDKMSYYSSRLTKSRIVLEGNQSVHFPIPRREKFDKTNTGIIIIDLIKKKNEMLSYSSLSKMDLCQYRKH